MTTSVARAASDVSDQDVDGTGRRDVLRRLAVGGAIVWTAPVITSSVAAAATTSTPPAACSNNYVYDWDLGTEGTVFTSSTAGGVTMTWTTSFYGGTGAYVASGSPPNKSIVPAPAGGINQKAIILNQTPVNGGGQQVTMNFSKWVRDVSFIFMDIDNLNNAWSDRIIVDTTPFTFSIPGTSTVTGAGTEASPFRNTQASNNLDNNSGAGNVQVTWAGPVQSITFRFQCATPSGGNNQLIKFSDISFCR